MTKPVLIADTECYKDYWLLAFRNVRTGNVRNFELYDGHPLDVDTIRKILSTHTIITFNGIGYDMPQIFHALKGASCKLLKASNDFIIGEGRKWWQVEQKFGFKISDKIDHIDIFELLPLKASLKMYGGRIHTKTLVDLPFDPSASISVEDREMLKSYCATDLILTQELYEVLRPQIELREKMGEIYKTDLRSKSDAAIAETIIKMEVEKITKNKIEKPKVKEYSFRYKAPEFIKFDLTILKELFEVVQNSDFYVQAHGKVNLPKEISDYKITIDQSTYACGIGGLHSQEANVAHIAEKDYVIKDFDVRGYYPSIILQTGLYPPAMGKTFLKVYKDIVERRNIAKASGDKVTADTLKITSNASYGKLSNQYSSLYAPELSIQVTMTGQLALLMLIEQLEIANISVISANTDGIVVHCRKDKLSLAEEIVKQWEQTTGFETENVEYRALYNASVNAYIALKSPSGYKLKGAYTPPGLQKNPTNEICTEAVVQYLDKGTDIIKTIETCKDIRKFLTVRKVTGGAVKDGEYLGKVIRWYYGRLAFGDIKYKLNNHAVPRSEGAEPCMTLPDEFPCDVNLSWYIDEAYKILKEIGA